MNATRAARGRTGKKGNLSSRLYRDDTKFLPLQGEGKDGDGFA
jgi:hypothetical protein